MAILSPIRTEAVPLDLPCPAPLVARGFSLREETPADESGLRGLYARHRWGEFAPLGLPEAEIAALIDMQYTIQHRQYLAAYAHPRFHVLSWKQGVAGRLLLGETGGSLRILDILVAPALRGQGVGGALLSTLLGQAGQAGWRVSLHVAKGNPAQRLYERLGFTVVGDIGIAWAMDCPPPGAAADA